ncbi:LysR family transcriptional regulator [Cryobacterium sp. Sr8]|uniref:helix-turn-helix domain-containing protein n=1 Tax=Cryobacterium sp. Sr8 TaxID=1259203 RepID=UPI00106B3C63|nr:LysR family transcriptional regulator [Cryobacterium sp. Sr8]TFD79903.1 LysR family transcriptional regulator [Cryobacterium sp. Sr8]
MVQNRDRVTADAGIELILSTGIPLHVTGSSAVDLWMHPGALTPATVKVRQKPPTPSEIQRDLERTEHTGPARTTLLYIVPRLTSTLREMAAVNRSLAIAALSDQTVLIDGREFRPETSNSRAELTQEHVRRQPWGRHALTRVLLRTCEPRPQTVLAKEAGVTQAAVSQALKALEDQVERHGRGWVATNPGALFDQFLATYPGPRGIRTSWYGLDPVANQARRVLEAGTGLGALLSGDAAADSISPWRIPSRAVIYAHAGMNLAKLGFAESNADSATLEYTVPADHTLWATAQAWVEASQLQTVDPLITAWDVIRIGGPDAGDAVGKLRETVLSSWAKVAE